VAIVYPYQKIINQHRPRYPETLTIVTAHLPQSMPYLLAFDTFSNHIQPQTMRHLDDGIDDRRIIIILL